MYAQCRKLNLLSFGEEAEEEEKELAAVKKKIKSSHDVLDDPRLLKEAVTNSELVIAHCLWLLCLTMRIQLLLNHECIATLLACRDQLA